jgi:hypothetical protein
MVSELVKALEAEKYRRNMTWLEVAQAIGVDKRTLEFCRYRPDYRPDPPTLRAITEWVGKAAPEPLTSEELQALRRLLPLLLELEPELVRLSEGTFRPTVAKDGTHAQYHQQSLRGPSASTPPAARPSDQSE